VNTIIGIIAMAVLGTGIYLYMGTMLISLWSAPRRGPLWATYFMRYVPPIGRLKNPRTVIGTYLAMSLVFEGALAYIAAQPAATQAGSAILWLQILLVAAWTI
jgi:hypothetical protein